MRPQGRDVVITGIGTLSAAGVGWSLLGAAPAGEPTALGRFDASSMPARVAFQVESIPIRPYLKRRKDLKLMSREARLGLVAAALALDDAGFEVQAPATWPQDGEAIGLFMGVGLEPGDVTDLGLALARSKATDGGIDLAELGSHGIDFIPPLSALKTLPNMALAHVSINLGLMGPGESLSPWSSAGLSAIRIAAEAVARGECEIALAGATDSEVDLNGVTTWHRMGLLKPDGAGPGSDGLILGEGAAMFVLEAAEVAEARGARPWARIVGARTLRVPTSRRVGYAERGLDMLLADIPDGALLFGAADHHADFRRIEAAAASRRGLSAPRYPADAYGSCGAASGALGLATALAKARSGRLPDVESVVALAWSPGGELAQVTVDALVVEDES